MGASQSCAVLPRHTFLHKICQMLWWREGLKIEDYLSENKISKGGDILRIPEKYRKYRYANISQLFQGFKNADMLGDCRKT